MDDKLRALLRTLETAPPPEGAKDRVLRGLCLDGEAGLNRVQRLLFTHPLRAAGIIAMTVSGLLAALLGSGYPALLLHYMR